MRRPHGHWIGWCGCALVCLFVAVSVGWAQEKPGGTGAARPPLAQPAEGPPAPALELTAAQKAKAEILALKVTVAQLRATLADRENKIASIELSKEQASLQEEFLAQTKAPKDAVWDWQTMAWTLPPSRVVAEPAKK